MEQRLQALLQPLGAHGLDDGVLPRHQRPRHGVVREHAVDERLHGQRDDEASVANLPVVGEARPPLILAAPFEDRARVDADVEDPPHAALRELPGLRRDVPLALGVAHLEGDLLQLPLPLPVARDREDAHVGGEVVLAVDAREHVHRDLVVRREAAGEHVGHRGVPRRVRGVGPHRLDHHPIEHLRVRLGGDQPLVETRQRLIATRRPRGDVGRRSAGSEKCGRRRARGVH